MTTPFLPNYHLQFKQNDANHRQKLMQQTIDHLWKRCERDEVTRIEVWKPVMIKSTEYHWTQWAISELD